MDNRIIIALVIVVIACIVITFGAMLLNKPEEFSARPIVCIMTSVDSEELSGLVNYMYANKHGHNFKVESDKYPGIVKQIETGYYDYILWLDENVIINDMEKDIYKMIEDYNQSIVVSSKRDVLLLKSDSLVKNKLLSGSINDDKNVTLSPELEGMTHTDSDFIHNYKSDPSKLKIWKENHPELFKGIS